MISGKTFHSYTLTFLGSYWTDSPDYDKLRLLRTLYPQVPILALSATCGPQVLQDLIQILRLNAVVDGNGKNSTLLSVCSFLLIFDRLDAPTQGTVYFSSPLYRKNLHYRVVPKPGRVADHLEAMRDYILDHHPNDTGIIYCFSTKVFSLSNRKALDAHFHVGYWACSAETKRHKQRENQDGRISCKNSRVRKREPSQGMALWYY